MAVIVKNFVQVYGARRNGNHIFIQWLLERSGPRSIFCNNLNLNDDPISDGLFRGDHFISDGRGGLGRTQSSNILALLLSGPPDLVIYSYEEKPLSKVPPNIATNAIRLAADSIRRVLIIRDLYNFAASLWKYIKGDEKQMRVELASWVEHASEAIGRTNYLAANIIVLYDNWISMRSVRDTTATLLPSCRYPEYKSMTRTAFDSSFDGLSMDGHAQKMDVLNRWKIIASEPKLHNLLEEATEARVLSRILFGSTEAESLFKNN